MVRGGAESRRGHDNLCATERSRKAKPPADEFSQPPSQGETVFFCRLVQTRLAESSRLVAATSLTAASAQNFYMMILSASTSYG